jgi:hypothetical protein
MRTRTLLPFVVIAGLSLAACSPASPSPQGPDATQSATQETTDFSDISSYYPVAVGNTWEYSMTLPDPLGTVTETETMTDVVRVDDDSVRATIERTFHYENGSVDDVTDSVDYVFHSDGSLEVPYQSLPDTSGTVVTVKSGTMVWPTDEEFEAGTEKTGTIEASANGVDQTVDFAISGGGVETVKVPAGSFDARLLNQKLTISIPSLSIDGLPISAKSWLAPGTGLVKTEIPGLLGTGSVSLVLEKFTPGA